MSENVDTVEEVNRCHEKFVSGADKWQLTSTRRPVEPNGI